MPPFENDPSQQKDAAVNAERERGSEVRRQQNVSEQEADKAQQEREAAEQVKGTASGNDPAAVADSPQRTGVAPTVEESKDPDNVPGGVPATPRSPNDERRAEEGAEVPGQDQPDQAGSERA